MTPGSGTPASTFLGRRAVRAGVAGALAGLAVLARPAALLAALLLVPTTGSRRRSLALALGLVAAMAPWLMRNWVVLGSPVLTTNSGVTLVGANCEAALHAKVPGKWLSPDRVYSSHDLDKPDLGMWGWSELGEVESSRRFAAHALGVVRSQPGRWLTLTGWKLVRLFDPDPRSQKPDAWWKAIVGWLTVTPVLVLVLVGCWDIRRRPRAWLPFLAPLIGTLLTAAIFYGDTRMRTAADPTLLLLAAAGVLELARRARAGTQPPPQVLVK